VKLAILSDLHLDHGPFALPTTDADLILLAGDIASPREAIAWARRLGKPAVYVAGNHEFYDSSIDAAVHELRRLCAGTSVRFLEQEAAIIDGVRFVGATLWTDFMLYDEPGRRAAAIAAAARWVRDFHVVRVGEREGRLFTPADAVALHRRSSRWLAATLAHPHTGPTVVITHHAPSALSIHPRFADSPVNVAFVSNAEYLLDGRQASLWVHGHTHDSFDYVVNGTRVVCNPRGYPRDGGNENRAFDPGLVVEV